MQKIRDFIYNTSDIMVAVIIIAVAAFLIWTRVGVIMEYPNAGTADIPSAVATEPDDGNAFIPPGEGGGVSTGDGAYGGAGEEGAASGGAVSGDGAGTDAPQTSTPEVQTPPESGASGADNISLYIAYGETGADIAQKLLDAGMISTKEEFYDAVAAANAATKLQAGTFIIPVGATPAEIVNRITR